MPESERREFLKATAATLVGAAGIGALFSTSCNRQTEIRNPTREELVKRLEKLAKSGTPRNLILRPTCYQIAIPPHQEIPCSVCKRTMKVGEKDEFLREYNVPLKRIQDQGVDIKLIFPEHCPECGFGMAFFGMAWEEIKELSPEELKSRKLSLEIKYPDQPAPVRVELESALDLELMAHFLQGKDRADCGQIGEEPLKDKVARLKELFGVAEKE
jgi:ribosomal protein L29